MSHGSSSQIFTPRSGGAEDLQTLLGEHQDAIVAADFLARLGAAGRDGTEERWVHLRDLDGQRAASRGRDSCVSKELVTQPFGAER